MENLNKKELINIENATEKRNGSKYDSAVAPSNENGQKKSSRPTQLALKKKLAKVDEEPGSRSWHSGKDIEPASSFRKDGPMPRRECLTHYKEKSDDHLPTKVSDTNRDALVRNEILDRKSNSRNLTGRKYGGKLHSIADVIPKKPSESPGSVSIEKLSDSVVKEGQLDFEKSTSNYHSLVQITKNGTLSIVDSSTRNEVVLSSSLSDGHSSSMSNSDEELETDVDKLNEETIVRNQQQNVAHNKYKTIRDQGQNLSDKAKYDLDIAPLAKDINDSSLSGRDTQASKFSKRVSLPIPTAASYSQRYYDNFKMQEITYDSISGAPPSSLSKTPDPSTQSKNSSNVTSASKYNVSDLCAEQQIMSGETSKLGLAPTCCAIGTSGAIEVVSSKVFKKPSELTAQDVEEEYTQTASKFDGSSVYKNAMGNTIAGMSKMGLADKSCAIGNGSYDLSSNKTSVLKSIVYADKGSEAKDCDCWKVCSCKSKVPSVYADSVSQPFNLPGYTQHKITIETSNAPQNNYTTNYTYGFTNSKI